MTAVVEVQSLTKSYGQLRAVDQVSFEVQQGEIFGMVGPNGAGKTTTIECLEGLRCPDSGHVRVLGLDPWTCRLPLSDRIGIQLQQSNLPSRLRVGEALDLFGSFYCRREEAGSLLERLGLADKRKAPIGKLSGGQRQRLFIALALVGRPELVFLDELTTGLDPQARRSMWDLVREIRGQGRTVFLTTHYMEEAEWLCDRVAILDHGKLIALDTPENLIRSWSTEKRVAFSCPDIGRPLPLERLSHVTRVERNHDRVMVHGSGDGFVGQVVGALEEADIPFHDLRTEQPNLEDVFLALTGRAMRE